MREGVIGEEVVVGGRGANGVVLGRKGKWMGIGARKRD
jgi:hypothetical protein